MWALAQLARGECEPEMVDLSEGEKDEVEDESAKMEGPDGDEERREACSGLIQGQQGGEDAESAREETATSTGGQLLTEVAAAARLAERVLT